MKTRKSLRLPSVGDCDVNVVDELITVRVRDSPDDVSEFVSYRLVRKVVVYRAGEGHVKASASPLKPVKGSEMRNDDARDAHHTHDVQTAVTATSSVVSAVSCSATSQCHASQSSIKRLRPLRSTTKTDVNRKKVKFL